MSEYLKNKIFSKCNNLISDIDDNITYDTKLILECPYHYMYYKSVKQILYKNRNCPECVRIAKNKKLSDIGKTKIGELNNFYGHTHSDETKQKLSDAWTKKDNSIRKQKISETVKSKECQDRTKNTLLERYGNSSFFFFYKYKQIMINKYGGFGNGSLIIRQHMQETCQEKYGVNSVLELSEVREKISNTMISRYGVDNAFKRPENQEKARKAYRGKVNKKEQFIINYLKTFYTNNIIIHDRSFKIEIDIFLTDLNLGIEYNGNYWHSYPRKEIDYHLNKSLYFKQFNIRLIHIYEFEDINQQLYLLKELINGNDLYDKNDFNKNNLLDIIVKPEPINTEKGIVYCAGKLY